MHSQLPQIGTRLSHNGSLGTIRFVGSVDGTQGVWLGIEWDDPTRGKHDGVRDGRRYFSCRVPNSGTFIRPTAAGISYGVSFLSALTAKYVETYHGTASLEKVLLGSSGGAIEVEAVGLDKIRSKLARLESLREVSLDNELVSKANPPGEVAQNCTGIRGLDLSKNLIPTWDVVADIAVELQSLRRLSLNQNRLIPLESPISKSDAFKGIQELQLSATLVSWAEFQKLLPSFPAIQSVELGYNHLRTLYSAENGATDSWSQHPELQSVNLDGNELDSFTDLHLGMQNLTAVRRLVLTSNQISHIHSPPKAVLEQSETASPLHDLKHLALAFNRLSTWADMDMLQRWVPQLESLTLAGNPLIDDPAHASYARAWAIAKIPSLKSLDGASISSRERADSELLYLSHISKQSFPSLAERRAAHPQWENLCSKHGTPDAPAALEAQDTLKNRMIGIHVHLASAPPPAALAPGEPLDAFLARESAAPPVALRVLSSMTVRALRLKLLKTCKVPKAHQAGARVWMVLPNRHFVELDEEFATRDLAYWGVEEGTRFMLVYDGGA